MNRKENHWKRTFFTIWVGQAFSLLGSSAAQFALIWWLTIKTGSPVVLALATILGFLPQAIIGPFAGVWVDRLSRKTVMITADLFIATASLVLAIAFVIGTPGVWLIYLILFLRAVGSVFHTTAMQAAMPLLVPESELMKTGGWSQFVQSGSFMLGPALGTILMTTFSVPAVMLIDIVGAVIAAVALTIVKIPDPEYAEKRDILGEMLEGLREINQNKTLKAISIPILLTTLIYVPVSSLFPLMVNGHFGGTAWHASVIEFLFAGGLLISSLVIGVWGGLKNTFLMINLACVALGAALVVAGMLPPSAFVAFAGLCLGMGMTGNFFIIPYMVYIQTTVPPASLGRVLGMVSSLLSLATPLGLFVSGPIAEVVGVATWFAVSGGLLVLTGGLGIVMVRKGREFRLVR